MKIAAAQLSCVPAYIPANVRQLVALANHVGPSGPWTGCGGAALWAPGGTLLAEADDHSTTVAIADIPEAS
ncbi:carbon-nitrogen hydrolase family protein [Kitasatospora cathayae]|uniref:hypothetical protein n=1 Tax=Kitasatospora cathayae TaxID=3004092 RepID=UPI0038601667